MKMLGKLLILSVSSNCFINSIIHDVNVRSSFYIYYPKDIDLDKQNF